MEELDYRQLLREELNIRRRRNPSYSARALARDIAMSPPFLSQILSGTRVLSEERAHLIANKLRWPQWKCSIFLRMIRYQGTRDLHLRQHLFRETKLILSREKSKAARARFYQVQLEEFRVISDWQHMAIYVLADLPTFKDDSIWIANKLGLTPSDVDAAIERLLECGLMSRVNGQLVQAKGNWKIGSIPSAAIRACHRQQLQKAMLALETQAPEERDFSGTTMTINIKKLPRAKAIIRKFNEQLMQLMETGEQTAVYHLAIQFYRLDVKGDD